MQVEKEREAKEREEEALREEDEKLQSQLNTKVNVLIE